MRKLAPAFLLSSIVALSSGSAFAFGDMNKNKQAPRATTSDATAPADKTYTSPTNPSTNSAATASDTGKGGATASGAPRGSSLETSSPNVSSNSAPMATTSDKTYTSTTNPSTNSAATASDTGKGGATASGSTRGTAMSSDSSGMDTSKKKWTAKDCQAVAVTDPQYKSNNCASMKGGPG